MKAYLVVIALLLEIFVSIGGYKDAQLSAMADLGPQSDAPRFPRPR